MELVEAHLPDLRRHRVLTGGTPSTHGGYSEYSLEAHLPDLRQSALSIHNGGAKRRITNGTIKAKGTKEGRC